MESVPAKRRVTIYAVIKAITTLFVILIPMLRNLLMGSDISRWHNVSESHALVWIDEQNGVVFTITAFGDPNDMLHMASLLELVK